MHCSTVASFATSRWQLHCSRFALTTNQQPQPRKTPRRLRFASTIYLHFHSSPQSLLFNTCIAIIHHPIHHRLKRYPSRCSLCDYSQRLYQQWSRDCLLRPPAQKSVVVFWLDAWSSAYLQPRTGSSIPYDQIQQTTISAARIFR
jgi:hypothetical protein